MKVKLVADEMYRVYIAKDSDHGWEVEVPEALILKFQKADKEFKEMEEELYKLYKEAGGF